MNFKIGDIVRFKILTDQCGVVFGYAIGSAFAPYFGFKPKENIILAMRENGTVMVFRNTNSDYEVVGHVDMTEALAKIVNSKESLL